MYYRGGALTPHGAAVHMYAPLDICRPGPPRSWQARSRILSGMHGKRQNDVSFRVSQPVNRGEICCGTVIEVLQQLPSEFL